MYSMSTELDLSKDGLAVYCEALDPSAPPAAAGHVPMPESPCRDAHGIGVDRLRWVTTEIPEISAAVEAFTYVSEPTTDRTQEGYLLDFKAPWSDSALKTVVAFANLCQYVRRRFASRVERAAGPGRSAGRRRDGRNLRPASPAPLPPTYGRRRSISCVVTCPVVAS